MPPAKPADVRFYFDADILGLAKILVQVRADVTYPGDPGGTMHRRARPPCPITSTDVKDDVWIPQVAKLGWLIITRDSRIASNRAESLCPGDWCSSLARFPCRSRHGGRPSCNGQ